MDASKTSFMKTLSVLHLASFSGNIGDSANHMGFRPWFESLTGKSVEWHDLEIREFYWKDREFNADFVALANTYDLLIIGGGNYFELWVENSPTGTSIAIEPSLFSDIDVPVYFNALGVDPGQGVPYQSRKRFKAFLDQLLASEQYLVSVRNDGALDALQTHLGNKYAQAVHHVPDGGFFTTIEDGKSKLIEDGYRYIGISVANDMAEVRFAQFGEANQSQAFASEFAKAISLLGTEHSDLRFILFPHIFRDLEVIYQVISALDDRLRRTRIVVAPFGSGDNATQAALTLYKQCTLVLGMRFHSNVCPMGVGRPTLGLVCYRQIEMLYQELNQADATVDVSAPGFSDAMCTRINAALDDIPKEEARVIKAQEHVLQMRTEFEPSLLKWLKYNKLSSSV
jgi:polysaccharide pyruvyl transferase WcaK-like protein